MNAPKANTCMIIQISILIFPLFLIDDVFLIAYLIFHTHLQKLERIFRFFRKD
jgi:hypothetical protein